MKAKSTLFLFHILTLSIYIMTEKIRYLSNHLPDKGKITNWNKSEEGKVYDEGQVYGECVPTLRGLGASLVAQWLRICLPMQGTRVRALVWEDPTCRGATGPVSHNY